MLDRCRGAEDVVDVGQTAHSVCCGHGESPARGVYGQGVLHILGRHLVPDIVDASIPVIRSALLVGPRRYGRDRATEVGIEREVQAEPPRLELLDEETASPFVLRESEVE